MNFDLAIAGWENSTIHTSNLAAFGCPSDVDSGRLRLGYPYTTLLRDDLNSPRMLVSASYAGCSGVSNFSAFADYRLNCRTIPDNIARARGCFVASGAAPIRFAMVTDGLSHTIMVEERAISTFRDVNLFRPYKFEQTGWWFSSDDGNTIVWNRAAPNAFKTREADRSARIDAGSSLHPGGLNVLMADGSARFVSETIESWSGEPFPAYITETTAIPLLWQKLATRNGGEVFGSDNY